MVLIKTPEIKFQQWELYTIYIKYIFVLSLYLMRILTYIHCEKSHRTDFNEENIKDFDDLQRKYERLWRSAKCAVIKGQCEQLTQFSTIKSSQMINFKVSIYSRFLKWCLKAIINKILQNNLLFHKQW